MILSVIGEMASRFWKEIPEHFNHVRLDEFVIMPNHIHGITILDYSLVGKRNIMHESPVGTRHGVSLQSTNINNVGSCHGMTLLFDFFILEHDFFISIIRDYLLIFIFTMSVAKRTNFIVLAISCMR